MKKYLITVLLLAGVSNVAVGCGGANKLLSLLGLPSDHKGMCALTLDYSEALKKEALIRYAEGDKAGAQLMMDDLLDVHVGLHRDKCYSPAEGREHMAFLLSISNMLSEEGYPSRSPLYAHAAALHP